jgi:hypothetical protein
MKIISKFQDYYDIGIAYGVDEKLRFNRKTMDTDTTVEELRCVTRIVYRKQEQYYRILCHFNVMLFCGKAYPLVHVKVESITKKDKKFFYKLVDEEYCYALETLDNYIKQYDRPIDEINDTYEELGYSYYHASTFKKYVQGHFDKKYDKYIKLFDLYKMPYFYVESRYDLKEKDNRWHISTDTILLPQLKQYKFAKVVPPMQAFQEISMYLGKLNAVEDNTVTIEDKYLAQGKGFDCYSFKKIPRKRRMKRC